MQAIVEHTIMSKKKGRPKNTERDEAVARFDRTLLSRAKIVAGYRGITVGELLSDLLRGPLDRAYHQMTRELESGEGDK